MAQTEFTSVVVQALDTPILEQTQFGEDMQRWLADLIDSLNSSISAIGNGFANLLGVGQSNVGGAGAVVVVPLTGILPSNYVAVRIISTTNANINITSVAAGTNDFTVTFSADPGASAIIVYQAYTEQPR